MLLPSRQVRALALSLISAGGFALSACGGGKNPDREAQNAVPDSQRLGPQKVEILAGAGALTFADGRAEGSGLVRATDVLERADSANNFVLSFELAEDGSVTFVANAKRDLSGGVEVEFTRPAGGSALRAQARAASGALDLAAAVAGIDASKPVSLAIEIHNDHGNDAHVLLWNEATGQELVEEMIRGKGAGANWGVRLRNARVSHAARGKVRDAH